VFKKLEQAQENYPMWAGAIAVSEAQDTIGANRDQSCSHLSKENLVHFA